MKFVIDSDTVKLDYKDRDFWKQFDEIEVEIPKGWYISYVERGVVHTFDYCQSSGRGEYVDVFEETERKFPLKFTDDPNQNAAIMHKHYFDGLNAVLIRKP